ncbi:unnamed protein product [Merluccius merluccius]
MSCRAPRGAHPSLLPLRATVPFQLHRRANLPADTRTADSLVIVSHPPRPSIRRTVSLDAIVGPYLQGQWPKEAESPTITCAHDKATQTPSSWSEDTRGKRSLGGHKHSASWGSAEHLREVAKLRHQLQKRSRHVAPSVGCQHHQHHQPPLAGQAAGITQTIPLNRLASRLRRSVEGLNLELEEVFVSEKSDEQILDIPDGHRAPVPALRCSSGSQSEPSPTPMDPSLSPSPSPCALDPSLLSPQHSPCPIDPSLLSPAQSPCPQAEPGQRAASLPPSSSPHVYKTYSFQRQPPEGCERVRACDEATSASPGEPILQASCPDPNKVNFTPHGGSAFCPVSLLKPLLPSMDLLFRGLTVSPVTGCPGPPSPTTQLGLQ